MRTPGGPAIVMALLLTETAVGGLCILWFARLWGVVRWGFFKLAGAVLTICAALGVLAARGELLDPPAPASARAAVWLLTAFAAALVMWQVLLYARRFGASRIVGLVAAPLGVAGLVAIGLDPAVRSSDAVAVFQLLAGAVFAGAVFDGLLLGHWHLVDRTLPKAPIGRMNTAFLLGCVLAIGAAIPTLGDAGRVDPRISPLLGAGDLVAWLAIGLGVLCLVIGGFIRALIREGSIQSATGLFYLGVIMGFAAEFAAKVRFF